MTKVVGNLAGLWVASGEQRTWYLLFQFEWGGDRVGRKICGIGDRELAEVSEGDGGRVEVSNS